MLTTAFIAGMVLDVIGFAGSVVSARLIPLFLSQTIISANLVVTAVLGIWVLGIRLHRRDWAAIATVVVSLCVLGLTAGRAGPGDAARGLHLALLVAAMAAFAIGIVLIRLLGARAAVAAGLVSGVLYGLLAIAVRVVGGVDPLRVEILLRDPASWAIVLTGFGGFYLFTVALQLGSVNGAVAALVVGETVLPGIVGVALLGDSTAPGLGWLVALGFCTAVGGAVAVAVFGAAGHAATTDPASPHPALNH
jgi:drug/metabolite transporter (DMT)-like permease